MTKTDPSAALPLAHALLRFLIVVNWLLAPLILFLVAAPVTNGWIISSLDLVPGAEADRIIFGLKSIAMIGLVTVPINYAILTRLLAMVHTVRDGDPFVAINAGRLRTIAWALLSLQVLRLVIDAIVRSISTPSRPIDLDTGFSLNGWLAVLLVFVLARVFAEGTAMRDDLEGTV